MSHSSDPAQSSLSSSSSSAPPPAVHSAKATEQETADGDQDLTEGLDLLLQDELARRARAKSAAPGQATSTETEPTASSDDILKHIISDFHHSSDDLELDEETIAKEVARETGEDLVSSMEASLVNKVIESGGLPSSSSVEEGLQSGLSVEDALAEAVLNSEEALGNLPPPHACAAEQGKQSKQDSQDGYTASDPPSTFVANTSQQVLTTVSFVWQQFSLSMLTLTVLARLYIFY